MSVRRAGPRRTDRRSLVIAIVLSLLLPGLGHAYTGRLWRALVWFAGTIAVTIVLRQGREDTGLAIGMGFAMAVLSALDVALVMWLDRRSQTAR